MVATIHPLTSMGEFTAASDLQSIYWGDASEFLVPAHMLFSIWKAGGHILGAFDGGTLIGVLIGLVGLDKAGELFMLSKRMVVLPEYRGGGLGYQLKMAQRRAALDQHIARVQWTFDPMLTANAHLNLRKLGGIGAEYVLDYYGSDLADTKLGADRFIVDWWVNRDAVVARDTGQFEPAKLEDYIGHGAQVIAALNSEGKMPQPSEQAVLLFDPIILLEVPRDFLAIETHDSHLAQVWRSFVREQCTTLFDAGYVAMDVVHGHYQGADRIFYVLQPVKLAE